MLTEPPAKFTSSAVWFASIGVLVTGWGVLVPFAVPRIVVVCAEAIPASRQRLAVIDNMRFAIRAALPGKSHRGEFFHRKPIFVAVVKRDAAVARRIDPVEGHPHIGPAEIN